MSNHLDIDEQLHAVLKGAARASLAQFDAASGRAVVSDKVAAGHSGPNVAVNRSGWLGGTDALGKQRYSGGFLRNRMRYIAVATALVALLLVTSIGIQYLRTIPETPGSYSGSFKAYVTQPGQRVSITLADGSTMLLAPATTARVNGRAVELAGEALFTVISGPGTPFTVTSNGVTARVLGTSFSVRKYAEDKGVRVVVAEGKIGVVNKVLTVGDAASISNKGEISIQREANIAAELAWTTGRLGFNNVSFRETIPSLERWYGIRINAANEAMLNTHITTLFEQENSHQAMKLIAEMLNAQMIQHGTTITFTPKRK